MGWKSSGLTNYAGKLSIKPNPINWISFSVAGRSTQQLLVTNLQCLKYLVAVTVNFCNTSLIRLKMLYLSTEPFSWIRWNLRGLNYFSMLHFSVYGDLTIDDHSVSAYKLHQWSNPKVNMELVHFGQ